MLISCIFMGDGYMITIYVCIGSACHLKGSYKVIQVLQSEIESLNIKDKVEIKGSFCLSNCTGAVSVRIDDGEVFSINEGSTKKFLQDHVLPKL